MFPEFERRARASDEADRQMGRNALPFVIVGTIMVLAIGYLLR